jgi:two-component system, OmpR family, KDP operon response regulator KdpE
MKLLLIEDDLATVESINLCLEVNDPESIMVSTSKGLEAIQMLQNDTYDGVIIDLGLPDIDGIEVIEKIRAFSSIPIVVVSARHSPEMISKALSLGANDYITKPFDYRLLLNRLNKLVKNTAKE